MKRALSIALAVVIAAVGVLGLMLLLQSRDDASLDRPVATQTQTAP